MAFSGYLIKLGGSGGDILPLKYMRYETYKVTPNQRIDLDSTVATTGFLTRNVLDHTRSKIEFNVPRMNNTQINAMMTLIRSHWTNEKRRDITIEYYDSETDSYKTANCYMPDISYTITNIDGNKINYAETRIAFIEY